MHAKDHTGSTALLLAEKKKSTALVKFLQGAMQRQPVVVSPEELTSEHDVAKAGARGAAQKLHAEEVREMTREMSFLLSLVGSFPRPHPGRDLERIRLSRQ
jgi:hypothetical protein